MEKRNLQKAFGSHLGFFGEVYYYDNKKVVKFYEGLINDRKAKEILFLHEEFVKKLKKIGIRLPKTEAFLEKKNRKFLFRIMQDRFEKNELAGEIIKKGSKKVVLETTKGVITDALKYIHSPLSAEIGFHPTIRNYAVRKKKHYLLDTFPPYFTEKKTVQLMIRHAPSTKARMIMKSLYPYIHRFTKEYYDSTEMLYGIYATASRLRPEYEKEICDMILSLVKDIELQTKIAKKINRKKALQKKSWKMVHRILYRKS